MESIKDIREEEARKLRDKIEEEGNLSIVEEMIKDNKIEFEINDKKYRVRLLNLKEKEELDLLKRKKYGQLLQDKDVLLKSEMIELYKQRGINVSEITEQINKIDVELFDKKIKLGEALSKNEVESILNAYKEEIELLQVQKQILITRESMLFEFALENVLLSFIAQAVSYLSLEIYENDTWRRLFKSFEEYSQCEDEELINKAGVASMVLQYA